jgi:hypothetical protein
LHSNTYGLASRQANTLYLTHDEGQRVVETVGLILRVGQHVLFFFSFVLIIVILVLCKSYDIWEQERMQRQMTRRRAIADGDDDVAMTA